MDLAFAIVHHLAVFTVFGVLLAEFNLLRLQPAEQTVRLISRVDLAYGIAAGVAFAAGVLRVLYGVKGAAFYTGNPVFWLKLGLFIVIGLVSIGPTLQYARWRRELAGGRGLPGQAERDRARRRVHVQLGLFIGLPIAAAMMARGIGL